MIARLAASTMLRAFPQSFAALQAVRQTGSSAMAEPLVLSKVENGIGEITLNRPRALNSLNLEMVTLLYQIYRAWSAPDSGVKAVVLTGAGGKAFCAGGDVKQVALQVMDNHYDAAMAFFKQEYLTDAAISQLRLPHISLLDGITMGGGAGVSMHGHFRVATERTVFAMPECAIGLFPDVGMMAHLPHLPGELGAYLALTGARLTGIQLKEAGLATHFIPSSHLPQIKLRLHQAGSAASDLAHVSNIITDVETAAGASSSDASSNSSSLTSKLPVIARCFGKPSVGEIVAALQQEAAEQEWCREALQQLQRGSPLSAAVTLSYYHRSRAQHMSPVDCLEQDAILCGHFMAGDGDFAEGVRARLIDKDDRPTWKHNSHSQVPADLVERFFTPRNPSDVVQLHEALNQQRGVTSNLASRL